MMLKFLIPCLVFLVVVSASGSACTCGLDSVGSEQRIRYDKADFVFTGRVIELGERIVRIKPVKFYKGIPADTVSMLRSVCSCTCDIDFNLNSNWLIYARISRTGDEQMLVTDVCDGTDRYENSGRDLDYLENPPKVGLPYSELSQPDNKSGITSKGKKQKKKKRPVTAARIRSDLIYADATVQRISAGSNVRGLHD